MLNTEEYKLFLQNNCLLCRKYKGSNEDNCGINKKIEISQYLSGVAAEAIFPLKDLEGIPIISKYSCMKFQDKDSPIIKITETIEDEPNQLKMF